MSTATESPRVLTHSTTTSTPRRSATHRVRRVVLPALVLLAGLSLWVAVTYLVLDERRRFLLPPPWAVAHTGLVDPNSRSAIAAALGKSPADKSCSRRTCSKHARRPSSVAYVSHRRVIVAERSSDGVKPPG